MTQFLLSSQRLRLVIFLIFAIRCTLFVISEFCTIRVSICLLDCVLSITCSSYITDHVDVMPMRIVEETKNNQHNWYSYVFKYSTCTILQRDNTKIRIIRWWRFQISTISDALKLGNCMRITEQHMAIRTRKINYSSFIPYEFCAGWFFINC